MTPILRLCDSCIFYNDNNTCQSFPNGIPLLSDDVHFEVLPGQVGTNVYEMDSKKYDKFEMYRRIYPEIRFPILLTYDLPEAGDSLQQSDLDVEVDTGAK